MRQTPIVQNYLDTVQLHFPLMRLKNIDKHILFVKTDNSTRTVVEMARTNVFANSPHIFVISGVSTAAEIVRKCEETITKLFTDYELERISSGFKENLFYKRILKN